MDFSKSVETIVSESLLIDDKLVTRSSCNFTACSVLTAGLTHRLYGFQAIFLLNHARGFKVASKLASEAASSANW